MPFVFGIAGVLLIVSGVRGTTTQLMSLVKDDFTGQPNYLEWMFAIFLVGAVGYIKDLAPLSRAFMVALIIGLVFSNKGVFPMLTAGISSEPMANTLNTLFNVQKPETSSASLDRLSLRSLQTLPLQSTSIQ